MKPKAAKILECAAHCLEKYGVGATNSQKIADELGIPQSTVFYYFPTNQALFSAMIELIVDKNHRMIAEVGTQYVDLDPIDRLSKHLAGNIHWCRVHPSHVTVLMYCYVEAKAQPHLGEIAAAALKAGQQRIYELLAVGFAEGRFKPRLPIKELSEIIHGSLTAKIIEISVLPQEKLHPEQTLQDQQFVDNLVALAIGQLSS